jgi:hypothetical protein
MGSGWTGGTGLEKETAMITVYQLAGSRETQLKMLINIY